MAKNQKNVLLFLIAVAICVLLFFILLKGPNKSRICENIGDIDRQGDCLIKVAINSMDKSVCGYVSDTNKQETCLLDIAVCSKDKSICELFSNETQGDCLYQVGENLRIVTKDAFYSQEENAVHVLLENRCPEPIVIDRVPIYPTPESQKGVGPAVMIEYTLNFGEVKEFVVPVESKPYKIRIMTDNQNLAPFIVLSDWE